MTTTASANIGTSDVEKFETDGAIVLRKVFSEYWIDKVQQGIERNLKNPSQYAQWLKSSDSSGIYFNDYCNWRKIPEFKEFVKYSPASEIVASLLKSKVLRFYHEHVLDKSPGTEKPTPWHQDQPYYPFDGNKVCSMWMPVDFVPYESSLQVICGSHKWGRWFKPRMFATLKDYDSTGLDEKYESLNIEEMKHQKVLQWEVQPGDCVIFHMLAVHGAAGNPSPTNHRRVLATRWLGEDACITTRPWQVSPPLTAVFGNLQEPAVDDLFLAWSQQL